MIIITIDNLNIRLKGLSVEKAKVVSTELRNQLIKQMDLRSNQQLLVDEKPPAHYDLLDAGVIAIDFDAFEPSKISELMASRIVNSIFSSINQTCEEEK